VSIRPVVMIASVMSRLSVIFVPPGRVTETSFRLARLAG
jgi:hypothetical protein